MRNWENQTWDTREISMIIENSPQYIRVFERMNAVGNELYFMTILYVLIKDYNKRNEGHIDPANVNGNEVYISFCEAVGNETSGWC